MYTVIPGTSQALPHTRDIAENGRTLKISSAKFESVVWVAVIWWVGTRRGLVLLPHLVLYWYSTARPHTRDIAENGRTLKISPAELESVVWGAVTG